MIVALVLKRFVKFAARKQVIDVCNVPSQSATDQKVVPLPPLRKNLDGSHGMLCRYAFRVQIQSSVKPCVDERSAIPKGSNTTKAKAKQTPNGSNTTKAKAKQTSNGSNTTKAKAKQTCPATSQKKRKCLDISEKVKVLEFAKKNPNLGSRKLADHFGIGKTH